MLLVNSGGGFVEGDVSHFHGVLEPGTRALFTTTASSKFYKCPGGAVSREIVDLHVGGPRAARVLPGRGDPLRAEPGAPDQPHSCWSPSSRLFATDMVSAGRVHLRRRARSSASTTWSRSSASPSAAAWSALDRLMATDGGGHRLAGAAVAGAAATWRTAFAYAPDLAGGRGGRASTRRWRRRGRHRGRRHPHRQPRDRAHPQPRDVAGARGALRRLDRAPGPAIARQERTPDPQVLRTPFPP